MGYQPENETKEVYCVDCKHYKKPWFEDAKCFIVRQRHRVTKEPTEVFEEPILSARDNFCKGEWYEHKPVYYCY